MSFCSGSSHSELPALETVTPKYWRETGQSDTLRHANSHQAHTHVEHTWAWCVNEHSCSVCCFISRVASCFGDDEPVSRWAAEPEDWCLSAEAEQWYDMRSCSVTWNRDTQRDSCHQTPAPVYRWPTETGPGPPGDAHVHMISDPLAYTHTWHALQHAKISLITYALSQRDINHRQARREGGITNIKGCRNLLAAWTDRYKKELKEQKQDKRTERQVFFFSDLVYTETGFPCANFMQPYLTPAAGSTHGGLSTWCKGRLHDGGRCRIHCSTAQWC